MTERLENQTDSEEKRVYWDDLSNEEASALWKRLSFDERSNVIRYLAKNANPSYMFLK